MHKSILYVRLQLIKLKLRKEFKSMNNAKKNINIRKVILLILEIHAIDSHILIKLLAILFNTTKQRVCGNLSYLKKTGAIKIYPNAPHSIVY